MTSNGGIDWDGLGTFALTLLLGAAAVGVPFILALLWVFRVGLGPAAGPVDGPLVVFGKRLLEDQPDADYRARLTTAAALAARHPGQPIIILGGRTGTAQLSEAQAGARWLRSLPDGAALHIMLEQRSGDTLTNLRNLRELLAGTDPPPLTMISNRYHLARLAQIAASLGLAHRLFGAESISAALRPVALRRWPLEAFYVTWFATGKLWAGLTRNRRMLARVT